MTRRPIEELVVGAARGEPMDVDERERLADALASSPQLAESLRAQRALTSELAALRTALQPPPASAADEERLREAFRAAALRRGAARPPVRPRTLAASFAAAVVALVVAVTLGRSPGGRDAADASIAAPTADATRAAARASARAKPTSDAAAVFYALPYAPGLSLAGSYSLVRVRIPLASFAADGGLVEASVEADVLIGDDGIPSAIHFGDHATLLVSRNSDR